MKIYLHSYQILISLMILSTFLLVEVRSFEMNCAIQVFSNSSFQINCTSDKKFKFCILEKRSSKDYDKKPKYCKFHFNQPVKYPGEINSEPTRLELYYKECSLDPESSHIQIVDKYVKKQCHLRISHFENSGKFKSHLRRAPQIIIFFRDSDKHRIINN